MPKRIEFQFKRDPNFGMINLGRLDQDLNKIVDPDRIISAERILKIHFPLGDHYYVKTYTCPSIAGFTLRHLMNLIVQTGPSAFDKDLKENPQNYIHAQPLRGMDILSEYAIAWDPKESDIVLTGTNVFVSLQH